MAINEFRYFIFESYYRSTGFFKENSYFSIKNQNKKDLQLFTAKLK